MSDLDRTSLNRATLAYYEREKQATQEALRTALLRTDREAVRQYSARLYWIMAEIKRLASIAGVQS